MLCLAGCGKQATGQDAETVGSSDDVVVSTVEPIATPVPTVQPTPEPTATPSPTPTPEPPSITLVMVGDMLMHERVMESGLQEDGSYEFGHLFQHVEDRIQAADIALVNQETILGGTQMGLTGYPCLETAAENHGGGFRHYFDASAKSFSKH